MARRREDAAAKRGPVVPVELLDLGSVAWQSIGAAQAWCARHHLPAIPHQDSHTVLHRHRSAAARWAVSVGMVLDKAPAWPDWSALRAAGVDLASPDVRGILRNDDPRRPVSPPSAQVEQSGTVGEEESPTAV